LIKEDSLYALQLEVIDRKKINNKYKDNIQACLTSEDYFKDITNQTNIKRDEIKELFTNWKNIRKMINYLTGL